MFVKPAVMVGFFCVGKFALIFSLEGASVLRVVEIEILRSNFLFFNQIVKAY